MGDPHPAASASVLVGEDAKLRLRIAAADPRSAPEEELPAGGLFYQLKSFTLQIFHLQPKLP